MSFKAVTWAFDQVIGLSQGEKLVLLALAEFANDDNETWRSREALASRALCSVRSVVRHLQVLEDRGFISRTARYGWCEDVEGECAGRARHKHRVGTMYVLHLDVTGEGVSPSTSAKMARVEKVAESQGKVHKCQNGTCGGGEGSTGAKSGSPQVPRVSPITNRNYPPIKPPPSPQPPTGREGGEGSCPSSTVSMGGLSPEVMEKIALSLPDAMCALDVAGMRRVWQALRQKLDAGWTEAEIRRQLGMRSLPEPVHDMASLVCHRISALVDVPLRAEEVRQRRRERLVNQDASGGGAGVDPNDEAEYQRIAAENPAWSDGQVAREFVRRRREVKAGAR